MANGKLDAIYNLNKLNWFKTSEDPNQIIFEKEMKDQEVWYGKVKIFTMDEGYGFRAYKDKDGSVGRPSIALSHEELTAFMDYIESLEKEDETTKGKIKKKFETEYYVEQFDKQQEMAKRIRECAMQIYEDSANIASGALNVCSLDISIEVFSDWNMGAAPTIDVHKEYIPKCHLERRI